MNIERSAAREKPPKKMNKVTLLLIIGLIGIFFIGIAPMLASKEPKSEAKNSAEATAEEYSAALEARLTDILGKIEGVGSVEVMVTLQGGYSYSYAVTEKKNTDVSEDVKNEVERKTQQKNTTEQNYVLVDGSGGGSEPLITRTNEPSVKGVIVVCDGGGNPTVVSQITQAVKVALDISSARITVSRRSPS